MIHSHIVTHEDTHTHMGTHIHRHMVRHTHIPILPPHIHTYTNTALSTFVLSVEITYMFSASSYSVLTER